MDIESFREETLPLLREVVEYHGKEYILWVLKGIARSQFYDVQIPPVPKDFSPILKVYELLRREMESLIFRYIGEGEVEEGKVLVEEILKMLEEIEIE